MTSLAAHLDRCYAEHVGLRHPTMADDAPPAMEAFREALATDISLRGEAGIKRDGLVDGVTKKCFISKIHRAILDTALRN